MGKQQERREAEPKLNQPQPAPETATPPAPTDPDESLMDLVEAVVSHAVAEGLMSLRADISELDHQVATLRENIEMLEDTDARLDRVEEHVGLKPTLLSAVERVVGELDAAAQTGRINPKTMARLHRQLRAAAEEDRRRRIAGE